MLTYGLIIPKNSVVMKYYLGLTLSYHNQAALPQNKINFWPHCLDTCALQRPQRSNSVKGLAHVLSFASKSYDMLTKKEVHNYVYMQMTKHFTD